MSKTQTYQIKQSDSKSYSKIGDYVMLVKLKLSLLVVFTSLMAYVIVAGSSVTFIRLALLAIGGFLVTGAANALNQVLEKDYDKNMTRTADRPITTGRMKSSEAVLFAGLSCLIGVSILAMFNPLTSLLGMLSLICYSFVYTPMKRYSTSAVAVGAIPGALPALIGCTAFEGTITVIGIGLFALQFLWQFPHFWAIGYLSFDDYQRAGYKLLPEDEKGKVNRSLGKHATLYALLMIPVIGLMYFAGAVSLVASVLVLLTSILYIGFSYNFHKNFDRKSGLKLMFYSFVYLPIILAAYLIF
ncbi:MAG: heme o synthase [Saprospiraceae bacterium]|nr:heme o synthase [Saprospiraceae bacterium]